MTMSLSTRVCCDVTPNGDVVQAVVVARAMDTYDRLKWLQERCRFEQALEVAERDPTLKPATRSEVGHQAPSCKTCLEHEHAQEALAG